MTTKMSKPITANEDDVQEMRIHEMRYMMMNINNENDQTVIH